MKLKRRSSPRSSKKTAQTTAAKRIKKKKIRVRLILSLSVVPIVSGYYSSYKNVPMNRRDRPESAHQSLVSGLPFRGNYAEENEIGVAGIPDILACPRGDQDDLARMYRFVSGANVHLPGPVQDIIEFRGCIQDMG
jgi:hypothetical protein